MGTESANQHTIFRQRCKFCGGDHWNDLCLDYATVEVRKQLLKRQGMCFVCLKRGHRAFECLNKNTCFFCKRENHHHRSLCHQNVNFVPLNRTKLPNIKIEELSCSQDGSEVLILQRLHNAADKEQTSEKSLTQYNRTLSNVGGEYQILNELQQTKADLEESRKENTTLKEKMSKFEAEQELLQTSVSRFTDITQQLTNEIIQVKEMVERCEHKNRLLSMESQNSITGTNTIAKGNNTNKLQNNEQQRIGAERKFEDGNSDIRSLSITEKLQKSWTRLQQTDDHIEECSFLETEKAQRRGVSFSTDRQSAAGGTEKDQVENKSNEMQILKPVFKGLGLQKDRKTASVDSFTHNEQIVYAWVRMLAFLTKCKLL